MSQPAYVTTTDKTNTTGAGGTGQVYISPAHTISIPANTGGNYNINYVAAYDPATKETAYYQTETNAFGQNRYVDANGNYTTDASKGVPAINQNNLLGTRSATGEYTPNENYGTNTLSGEDIQKGFANNETVQQNLEATTKYTVTSGLTTVNGEKPTATQIEAALPTVKADDNVPSNPDPNQPTGSNPNSNPDPDDGGDGTVNQENLNLNFSAFDDFTAQGDNYKSKTGNANLIYPEGADLAVSDFVKFTAMVYEPSNFSSTGFGFETSQATNKAGDTVVYLPIQGTIADSNGVGWNEETINAAQIVGAEIAGTTMGAGVGAGLSKTNEVLQKAKNMNGEVKRGIIAAMTESAIGANILPRVSRAIFNPNTELLFQGPQLRAFSFTFKLTPRSDKEAAIVKDIIKFFKKNMSAKTTDSELFLKAPNIFKVEYIRKNGSHDGINLIKDCALQSFNVDYTSDGSYMAYKDGSMFSYSLTMQFMELTPIYSKDYDSGAGASHSIGY